MNTDIKIIKCLHVTQTERKHLAAFLNSGKTSAKVNSKYYSIFQGSPIKNGYEYVIDISTPKKNDYGKPYFDNQRITVQKINA